MSYALLKITCDMYAPYAILSPQATKWISSWTTFHSRRTIYPVEAWDQLTKEGQDNERVVLKDFSLIRVTTMDSSYNGVLDSGLDYIMANSTLYEFLGGDMVRIASTALTKAPPYHLFRTHSAWMELWEFDERSMTGQSIREITIQEIVENKKTPT